MKGGHNAGPMFLFSFLGIRGWGDRPLLSCPMGDWLLERLNQYVRGEATLDSVVASVHAAKSTGFRF